MPKYKIYTLGCKVNYYESTSLSETLERNGVRAAAPGEEADVCIINTCTVTSESDRKSRQVIRRAIKENPGAKIIVTGCSVETSGKTIEKIEGVDLLCGNACKNYAAQSALALLRGEKVLSLVPPLDRAGYEKMSISSSERTRAYIKIEDGCDNKCAYCIINRARGPVRSRPFDEIISEAKTLLAKGYKEIILTGIEVSKYSCGDYTLADVVLALDALDGLLRIGLSSIDPSYLRPDTVAKLARAKHLTPHFHISLQAGCDRTLSRMRRPYNTSIAARNLEALRAAIPGVAFTADVIVGFPGETDADFEDTLRFMDILRPLHLHVFAYSRRPDTEADAMGSQIDENIKSERSARLIKKGEDWKKVLLDEICASSPTLDVLFERCDQKSKTALGRIPSYAEIKVKTPCDVRNMMLPVRVLSNDGEYLYGEIEGNQQ